MIIHFTSSLKNIESMIKTNSFKLSYSKEDLVVGNQKVSQAAHPMVCFSEYEINELDKKNITYGKYAIAFSVKWARRKKISPVIYINQFSMAAKGIGKLLRARRNNKKSKLPNNLRLPIMQIKCYTKNEQGYNSYFDIENFNFKNENEWRYVPEKKDINGELISEHKSAYLNNPDYYNKKLEPYPLRFRRKDIEKVYVADIKELDRLIKNFPELKEKIELSNWNID